MMKRRTLCASANEEAAGHSSSPSRSKSFRLTVIVLALVPVPFLIGIFTGGSEFSMEQVKVKGRMRANIPALNKTRNPHPHDELAISSTLREHALEYVTSRHEAYGMNGVGQNWKMRGHGWLYTYQKIVLAARVSPSDSTLAMGPNSVQIFNVHPESSPSRNDCDLLTLWVRVNGPEIISGMPYAVHNQDGACYWQFDFHIAVPGNYTIDSKMIFWNGKAPVHFYDSGTKADAAMLNNEQTQCKIVYPGNRLPDQQFQQAPQKANVVGFKLYLPLMGCCEMCRRTPECQYWATPPKIMPLPHNVQNGCELYFGISTSSEVIPTSSVLDGMVRHQQLQKQRNDEAQAQANAAAQAAANAAAQAEAEAQAMANAKAQAEATAAAQVAIDEQQAQALVQAAMRQQQQANNRRRLFGVPEAWGSPYSDNPEVAYFVGCGWSFMFTLDFPCLSGDEDDLVYMEQRQFEAVEAAVEPKSSKSLFGLPKNKHAAAMEASSQALPQPPLPLCTLYDESIVPNVTAGVGRWVREAYPSPSDCPPYEEIVHPHGLVSKPTPHNPKCWHRSDMTHLNKQCKEMNCNLIKPTSKWQSAPLQKETQFYAIWKNYHCDYYQYTNDQLSYCFQAKGISNIHTDGASIAGMLKDYLEPRLVNVTMAPAGGKTMILSSVMWPHKLWKKGPELWYRELQQIPAQEEAYWVSPMFTSSEREPYVQLDRGLQFLELAQPILEAKGYHMINLFDVTAAMTYDTSAQSDGLHIVGPPMKYAMDRIFHHMCSGIVEGTRA